MPFHVSSVLNRESIRKHGMDPSRMGASRGIAGSRRPEADGVFLSRDRFEVDFFIKINASRGPVDLWAVEVTDGDRWVDTPEGFGYVAGTIPPERVTLVRTDIPLEEET